MSKLKDVTIVDNHTIRLNADAFKGDEIDLLDINNVDLSIIREKIDEHKDFEYNRRLESLKRELSLEKETEINAALVKSNEEIIKLKKELELSKNLIRNELEAKYKLDIEKLNNQIGLLNRDLANLENLKKNEITLAVKVKEEEIKDQLFDLKTKINNLEQEKKQLKESSDLNRQLELKTQEDVYQMKLKEQEDIINKLRLDKSSLNVKKMGEELEKWVEQEYHNYSLNGFDTSKFYKDNLVVKGTKADFIYQVFATKEMNDEDLLTSVAIEVKSENPETINKKKNSDHYQKLDIDRQKKNCEYALLISELEWDVVNDAPIRRVNEYEKMYLVRPQYFMVFIHILTTLSLKYKDTLKEHNIQLEKFRDSQEIMDQFEEMKSSILDSTVKYINNHIDEIIKSANNIISEGNKILNSANVIKDTHITTLINKIANFKISSLVRKINNL